MTRNAADEEQLGMGSQPGFLPDGAQFAFESNRVIDTRQLKLIDANGEN